MRPQLAAVSDLVPWDQHAAALDWDQGDHVTLIGPTKSGKTTLARAILEPPQGERPRAPRRHVLVLACKPRSPSMESYARSHGFRIVRTWEEVGHRERGDRVILWPRPRRFGGDPDEFEARQRMEFRSCMRDLYEVGGWTLYIDELSYVSEYLGLDRDLNRLWLQGREIPVTLVAAMQSPAYVPRYAYDQVQHVYIWRNRDLRRVKTLADLSGALDAEELERELRTLRGHQVLYVDPFGETTRTEVDRRYVR
jgi:hypothetical protein